jgi:hypothetical protein
MPGNRAGLASSQQFRKVALMSNIPQTPSFFRPGVRLTAGARAKVRLLLKLPIGCRA